ELRPIQFTNQTAQASDSETDSGSSEEPATSQQQDTTTSQQKKKEAPPFDRPPLNSREPRSNNPPDRRADDSSSSRQRPPSADSGWQPRADSTRRGSNRQQPSPSSDPDRSSAGGDVDQDQNDRSGGPPVLRRPSDSRAGGAPRSSDDKGRPPVLQRPGSQTRDEAETSAGRPNTSGKQQGTAGDDEVIKLESTLVNIPLLVSDRSGRYVPQLSARDFEIYEDGARQTIASFGSEEVPFSVVLLLDVSPSVQGSVQDIQDAAIAFVRQLRSQDRVMVVSFDRHIHYLSDFTN